MRYKYKTSVGKSKERDHLGNVDADGRILLQLILNTGFCWLRMVTVNVLTNLQVP
jgi:hypothetical protein